MAAIPARTLRSTESWTSIPIKQTITRKHRTTIELGDPDDESWPKVYTIFISVMEEDSADVAPWMKELYGDVKEFVLETVWVEMKKVLSDLKAAGTAALAAAVAGAAVAEVAAATAAQLAAILTAACTALWVMVAVLVAVVIIGEMIEGLDNDSYGSNGEVLVLPTNLYDYFNQVLWRVSRARATTTGLRLMVV